MSAATFLWSVLLKILVKPGTVRCTWLCWLCHNWVFKHRNGGNLDLPNYPSPEWAQFSCMCSFVSPSKDDCLPFLWMKATFTDNIWEQVSDSSFPFFVRTLCSVARVMSLSCDTCLDNCRYMVLTNKLSTVVDLVVYQMKVSIVRSCLKFVLFIAFVVLLLYNLF